MAEVILPPEELEPELPEEQLPQVEKPTEKSKVISVNFSPLNTKQTASLDTRESFFTTDTDAWIVLNVGDMNEPTGQYSLALINKEDGSIFQRTGDIVQGVAYYKLLPNEIKHAGRWVGQAVITLANGQTTASRFSFNVSGHILDGKDVREIVIQDFQTLMAQLNDLKDNSTNEFGLLKNEIEAFQTTIQSSEDERQATELERVAAEIMREENYESKVDAAIVEADVVTKVDDKVAELSPTINKAVSDLGVFKQETTAQLAQTPTYSNLITPNSSIKFIAHRGFSLGAPENTLPAYELAGSAGFWGFETDMQITSDGHLVVMHDDTLDRTTSGKGNVSDYTLSQVKSLKITSGNNLNYYKNLKVPTLVEFLTVCRKYNAVPCIELKTYFSPSQYDYFVNTIKKEGYEDTCLVMSFEPPLLNAVRERSKKIALQGLLDITTENIAYLKELKNADINAHIVPLTKDLVDLAHSNGLRVNTWGVTTPERLEKAINYGVDYITTDGLMRGVY